jgi:hypothetical protein
LMQPEATPGGAPGRVGGVDVQDFHR